MMKINRLISFIVVFMAIAGQTNVFAFFSSNHVESCSIPCSTLASTGVESNFKSQNDECVVATEVASTGDNDTNKNQEDHCLVHSCCHNIFFISNRDLHTRPIVVLAKKVVALTAQLKITDYILIPFRPPLAS